MWWGGLRVLVGREGGGEGEGGEGATGSVTEGDVGEKVVSSELMEYSRQGFQGLQWDQSRRRFAVQRAARRHCTGRRAMESPLPSRRSLEVFNPEARRTRREKSLVAVYGSTYM